jgi:hypothetical protein
MLAFYNAYKTDQDACYKSHGMQDPCVGETQPELESIVTEDEVVDKNLKAAQGKLGADDLRIYKEEIFKLLDKD